MGSAVRVRVRIRVGASFSVRDRRALSFGL